VLGGDVRGKRIAMQGVGAVGSKVARHLFDAGASLVVADMDKAKTDWAAALGAEIAPLARIHAVDADLFSPCALGAGLNAETIPELGAPIVCGAANNQLAAEEDGARLLARGITYAPDYVVNAGGIINVSAEYLGEPAHVVDARVRAIAPRLLKLLESAKSEGVPPHQAADRIVRERLAAAKRS
jgi:leucine dehydrogenase